MTWFAHDVQERGRIERLFDLFLSSHPLMPLYVAAAALKGARDSILACGEDGAAAYAALRGLQLFGPGRPGADQLAQQAAALYRSAPPPALLRRMHPAQRPRHSTAIHAFLRGGSWCVPEQPRPGGADFAEVVRVLRAALPVLRVPPRRRRGALLATVLSTVTGLALGAALLLAQQGGQALLLPWGQSGP